MNKFEELARQYADAYDVYRGMQKELDALTMKVSSAKSAASDFVLKIVVGILSEVAGYDVNVRKGIDATYLRKSGVLILDRCRDNMVDLRLYERLPSGRISTKKILYYMTFSVSTTGKVNFDEEFVGTPEEVLNYIKNDFSKWLTFGEKK